MKSYWFYNKKVKVAPSLSKVTAGRSFPLQIHNFSWSFALSLFDQQLALAEQQSFGHLLIYVRLLTYAPLVTMSTETVET